MGWNAIRLVWAVFKLQQQQKAFVAINSSGPIQVVIRLILESVRDVKPNGGAMHCIHDPRQHFVGP